MNPYEIVKEVVIKSDKTMSIKAYVILVLSLWLLFTVLM